MAFQARGLRCIGPGGALDDAQPHSGLWHYITNDAAAAVEAGGYFNSATQRLKKGDIIWASLDIDGTPALKSYIVTSATGAATVVIAAAS